MNELDIRRRAKYHERLMALTVRLGFAIGRVLTRCDRGEFSDGDLDRAIERCDELIAANREDQNG